MTGEAVDRRGHRPFLDALKDVHVQFWTCPNEDHERVTWTGDVAACDTCGVTSEMTGRLIRAAAAYERDRIADLADRVGATVPSAGGPMPFGRVVRHAGNDAAPEPDRAVCGRCGAGLARASWRLPWTASEAADPVWCVVDGVWQAHKPQSGSDRGGVSGAGNGGA